MRATIDADAKKQWGGKKSDIAYCCTKDMPAAERKTIQELERRQGYPLQLGEIILWNHTGGVQKGDERP